MQIENIIQNEQESTLIISLNQGVNNKDGLINGSYIPNFIQQRDAGLFDFKLQSDLIPGGKYFRLREITCCLTLGEGNTQYNEFYTSEVYPIIIKLPNQFNSVGNSISLPKLNSFATSYYKINKDFDVKSNTILNIDPFANDNWQITIPKRGSFHADGNLSRNIISNFFLILKIAHTN